MFNSSATTPWKDQMRSKFAGPKFVTRPLTSRSIEGRIVKDLSYYKQKLNEKIGDLKTELYVMRESIEHHKGSEKVAAYQATQANEAARELTEKQMYLSDLYVALDKANLGFSVEEVASETAKLKKINDQIEKAQESIFLQRMCQQRKVKEMEEQLRLQQNIKMDELFNITLDPSTREKLNKDPKKLEQAKLELQLWSLEQQLQSLQPLKQQSNETTIQSNMNTEEEVNHLFGVLENGVLGYLNGIGERIERCSKQNEYETIVNLNLHSNIKDLPLHEQLQYLKHHVCQLKLTDRCITKAINQLSDKTMGLKRVCSSYLNIAILECEMNRKKIIALKEKSEAESKCQRTEVKLNSKQSELQSYERQLIENESYAETLELEKKLAQISCLNYSIKEYLEEGKALEDLPKCRKRVLSLIDNLNKTLITTLDR